MGTVDLRQYVQDRLLAYDPTIDLSEGSPAQVQIVDPIVRRFTPDPFEMNIDAYIDALLTQQFPDYNFREGSGIRDLLVKPATLLMDPVSREVQLIKQGQSLSQPDLLASTEADALVANLFVSRSTGGLSAGSVRAYFATPMPIGIGVGNIGFTGDGLRFIPTSLQSISAEAMIFNQDGNLYYFDINYVAEAPGTQYNVDKGAIIGITNLNAAVRVTNLEKFENGLDEESTDELIDKAETGITERSLVTARGVSSRLRNQFSDLKHLQIVGFNDSEMERDVVTGGDLGPALLSGNDGYTEDSGDGSGVTRYFKSRYVEFTDLFSTTGAVENYYLSSSQMHRGTDAAVVISDFTHVYVASLTFTDEDVGRTFAMIGTTDPANTGYFRIVAIVGPHEVKLDLGSAPWVGVYETGMTWMFERPNSDLLIESVVGTHELKLVAGNELDIDTDSLIWSVRKKEITISDIPGGIIFTEDESISIQSDEIHIGGCSDFFVRGVSVDEETLDLTAISGESSVTKGTGLSADTTLSHFVRHEGKNFVTAGVKVGHSLIIEDGINAGTYTLLRVGEKPSAAPGAATEYLQVDPPITSTESGLRYRVVDTIDIDLVEPKTIRGEGTDGQVIQLSTVMTTAAAIDFLALGIEVGDILEFLTGANKGEYTIKQIGGVGNRDLTLDRQFMTTETNVSWKVYSRHTGLDLPLVRVSSIEMLDSSSQPTGDGIPLADPVDARSTSFSNAGRGVKVSTRDARTGIIGTVDLTAGGVFPLGTCVLQVSLNGAAAVPITLTGAASISELLNLINVACPNIAGTITYDSKTYLTLRSSDRWIQVQAGADNAEVGLDVLGEDNRQIKSAGVITDWTSAAYDLKAIEDVVSITTGDNIGFLYLVAMASSPNRLLAVLFDEETGRVRFLQPNVGVSMSVGSRSYGKARVYFLEPVSFQVKGGWRPSLKNSTDYPANQAIGASIPRDEEAVAFFTAVVNGATLRFMPDPELDYQIVPSPEGSVPNNLDTTNGNPLIISDALPAGDLGKNSRDSVLNFLKREVRVGDVVELTYQPIQGTADLNSLDYLPDPPTLAGETLIISIDGAPARTFSFSDQLTDPSKVAEEINKFFGSTIAYIETVATDKYLRLEADFEIVLYGSGTANTDLGLPTSDTNNRAAAAVAGNYAVTVLGNPSDLTQSDRLTVSPTPTANSQAQHFKVWRPGMQRLHSTAMNNQTENGLYYMDVELLSEGSGDQWNLDAGVLLVLEGYESEGYRLVVADANLSYSTQEQVKLLLSRRLLLVGSSDRPDEATLLSGQNTQLNYDRSSLTAQIQSFASSELERVLTASIVVRHLQPHYLNFTLNYRGGSDSPVVEQDIFDYLNGLTPDERVEVSEIQDRASRRSADYVENPIELVAVAHAADRSISVDRSEDYVTKGRLATFFPGEVVVTRETPTAL